MRIGDMLYAVIYNDGEVMLGDLDGPFICETLEEAEGMLASLQNDVDAEIIECYLTDE